MAEEITSQAVIPEPAQPPTPEPQPTITAEEAQNMPLNDLRKAVVGGEQPKPQIDSRPQQSPDWGQLQKNPDGTYHVTLATGEVFKGTAEQVMAEQGKAHVNTKRWAQEIKDRVGAQPAEPTPQDAEQVQQEQAAQQAQAAQAEAIRQWLGSEILTPEMKRGLVAEALGIPPEALQQTVQLIAQNNEVIAQQRVWFDFSQACPDYADTVENAEALAAAIEVPPGHPISGEHMARAWAYVKQIGKGQPAPVIHEAPHRRTPPPVMPSSGAGSQQASEADPWKIPLGELRKQVVG